jgi:hypothetical protein
MTSARKFLGAKTETVAALTIKPSRERKHRRREVAAELDVVKTDGEMPITGR